MHDVVVLIVFCWAFMALADIITMVLVSTWIYRNRSELRKLWDSRNGGRS